MLDTLLDYLHAPIVVLSGTTVTAFTLLTALAIFLIARIIAAMLGRGLNRVLERRGVEPGLRSALVKIARYALVFIGVFVALGTVGVDVSAITAAGAVLLVGVGFGLQKLAENFISGLLLLIERPVKQGDFIDAGGVHGTVEDVGWRATRVISRDGTAVIVPNSMLMSNTVINHSIGRQRRRIWVHAPVGFGEDLDRVSKVLLDIAATEPLILAQPTPEVRHDGFQDSSIDMVLLAWIADPRDDLLALSRLRLAISRTFRENGIEMPAPQREVHLKTQVRA